MSENPEKAESAISVSDDTISNAFQRILENPEIISTVAAAIGMPSPSKKPEGERNEASVSVPSTESIAAIAPLIRSLSGNEGTSRISSSQASLLRALKPYVNSSRCEAIDYIIKISEISQVLKNIN